MADPAIALARYLPGVVGLTRRVVHVVPVTAHGELPERLTAYCGEVMHRGLVELLGRPLGSPCVACLLRAPLPQPSEPPTP